MEGWGHDDEQDSETLSGGAARARGAAGKGARGRARVAGGGDSPGGGEDRLQRRDAAAVWVRQAGRDAGRQDGHGDERERIRALEREVRELRQAHEILRKAGAYFAQAELDRRPKP